MLMRQCWAPESNSARTVILMWCWGCSSITIVKNQRQISLWNSNGTKDHTYFNIQHLIHLSVTRSWWNWVRQPKCFPSNPPSKGIPRPDELYNPCYKFWVMGLPTTWTWPQDSNQKLETMPFLQLMAPYCFFRLDPMGLQMLPCWAWILEDALNCTFQESSHPSPWTT